MKVAIITWCCYYNFGTYLQAYALQTFLEKNGYDVKIINDYHYSLEQPLSVKIKCILKDIVKNTLFRKRYAYKKIDKCSLRQYLFFKEKYLSVDYQVDSLSEINQRYDIFVCGSDQIWNPGGLKREGNDFYFAFFADKPKIAYAPSIGVKSIPTEFRAHFRELISKFSYLSVREKTASKVLAELCEQNVETVLDPTLLLDREYWLNLVKEKHPSKEYLFLYLLTYNPIYIKTAYNYAATHHLQIRIVQPYGLDLKIKNAEPAGPLEFLNLISAASYVMTDSFHATIFSIHYQKDFVVFKRFKDTDSTSQNSRVENILQASGLSNRFLGENNLTRLSELDTIDFHEVDKRLLNERLHSQRYLLNALESVRNERS